MLYEKSFEQIKLHVENFCTKRQKNKEEIKIVAVSKLQPIEQILLLYNKGQRIFGENYVQEALVKMEKLVDYAIEWHLIGHIQTNKVKIAVGKFELIHSVDSIKLVKAINQRSKDLGITQKILLQINLAMEDSKSGFDYNEILLRWSEIETLSNIKIAGLMTMPPLRFDPEKNRAHFRELKKLQQELIKKTTNNLHPLKELSMGTSHDYEIAMEEGATYLRLGTVLFGERKKV